MKATSGKKDKAPRAGFILKSHRNLGIRSDTVPKHTT